MNDHHVWIEENSVSIDKGGPIDQPYDAIAAVAFETLGGIHLIEAVARRFPERLAVDDGTVRLTYGEFLDRVYGLAKRLNADLPAGAVVASLVPNTVASPVIIMACAIAGCILVPIDASHPLERQQAIFAESGAQILLLSDGETIDDSFVPSSVPRLVFDPRTPSQVTKPENRFNLTSPLFVCFTSGSTGRPKGVASGGRYGGTALRQYIDMFHINADDVILGLASLSTGGARDAFAALGAGATFRIFDMRAGGLVEALRVMAEDKVTILTFVPSALRMILALPGAEQAFRHLRVLDLHGERILASDIALFRSKLPATCHISVTMGSMEAGAVFSWFVQDEQIRGPIVPVGYLLPGRKVALLDDDGFSVSDGRVGELFIRGAMALGAWQGGNLVNGPFLPDPDDSASFIYPMGDLMRRRPDGLFEYVERKDRKVKIRGLWADLGEIESALRMIEGVADAVVISMGGEIKAEKLISFITMAPGAHAPTLGAVRTAVARETADHMAPSEVHVLDSIPRLANFKPDLMRLTAMARG